jgi:hypothetical protein
MRPMKESSPHEIYLRTSSAAKPNAPLKLYANVKGKFIVDRQLGAKVTDKVRQQTMEAKKQHSERQTIMLDTPPIPATGTKNLKRKLPGSGTVVKKSAQSHALRVPSASTAVSRKVSPRPNASNASSASNTSSKANVEIRRRLVHFLALEPRETDLAVARVCGNNCDANARANLLSILEDVRIRHFTLVYSIIYERCRSLSKPRRGKVTTLLGNGLLKTIHGVKCVRTSGGRTGRATEPSSLGKGGLNSATSRYQSLTLCGIIFAFETLLLLPELLLTPYTAARPSQVRMRVLNKNLSRNGLPSPKI